MFVLLYVLCVSLCLCPFVCIRHSIFYVCVTCCGLDVTMRRHHKSEREKARGKNNDLSHVPSKRKEEIKSGTSGCGSFVVPYFQPATSTTDHLHVGHHSTSKSSHVVFYSKSESRHVGSLSKSESRYVGPLSTSESRHVGPLITSESRYVGPLNTSESRHVGPLNMSESRYVGPLST